MSLYITLGKGNRMYTETEKQEISQRFWNRESPLCQSRLVSMLLSKYSTEDPCASFEYEDIENLYPDPTDWTIDQCKEYLEDYGLSFPTDPWSMSREDIIAYLEGLYGVACYADESHDELADALSEAPEDGEDWRETVRDGAGPAEPLEWWAVSSYFADKLRAKGECILDNDYGIWWGRCCSGQSVVLDGVIQDIAVEVLG